nr:hypothetical protein [uncultured Treponema sp.]
MKKFFIASIIVFSFFCTAEDDKKEIEFEKNKVYLVGKINMHAERNEVFKFYEKSWEVENTSADDVYNVYDDKQTLDGITLKNHKYLENDYFISARFLDTNGTVTVSEMVEYHFYGSALKAYLPLYFKVTVPKGEKLLYIGDFDFYLDSKTFTVSKITVSENFDSAKNFLKKHYIFDQNLCRVEIQNLE